MPKRTIIQVVAENTESIKKSSDSEYNLHNLIKDGDVFFNKETKYFEGRTPKGKEYLESQRVDLKDTTCHDESLVKKSKII